MANNFKTIGVALEVTDLGLSVLKTARRHYEAIAASRSTAAGLDNVGSYVKEIQAVIDSIFNTTEVLKHASVHLDIQELGRWATENSRRTALRAFESCKESFHIVREHVLQDPVPTGDHDNTWHADCEELASARRALEQAKASLLLMLAVLKLKQDTESSDGTSIALQGLQVQNLVAQLKAIGLGEPMETDGAVNEADSTGHQLGMTPVSSQLNNCHEETSGVTPSTLEHARSPLDPNQPWDWTYTKIDPTAERCPSTNRRLVGSVAFPPCPSSPSVLSFDPCMSWGPPPDTANLDTLLLQAAQCTSTLATAIASESHTWYKYHRMDSNAIRGSLEMVKSKVEGLLGTFELCKGMYPTPGSVFSPAVITDLVDCFPHKKPGRSKKKVGKKAKKNSKFKQCLDEPPVPMPERMRGPPTARNSPDPFRGMEPITERFYWPVPVENITSKPKHTHGSPYSDPFANIELPSIAKPPPRPSLHAVDSKPGHQMECISPRPSGLPSVPPSFSQCPSRRARVNPAGSDISWNDLFGRSTAQLLDKKSDMVAELLQEWTRDLTASEI